MAKKTTKTAKSSKAPKTAKKSSKISQSSKPRKKSELFNLIAEHTELSRKQVAGVFETLGNIMAADLAKPSDGKPRIFVVPGMMKVQSIYKPATKSATKPNPFAPGEMMTVKAKPARTVVKVRPLKGLKDMV